MIQLTNNMIVREIGVQGGIGDYAYWIHFSSNGLPQVGLEPEIRIHDSRLAGFYFRHQDRDWIIVRGQFRSPTVEQLAELDKILSCTILP